LSLKTAIFTADDFGLSAAVNEAVECAHRDGILNTASLMVAAPGAADAVARARLLPGLAVGLHITLVDGSPASPPSAIKALIRADGTFHTNLVLAGCLFFFHPNARAELRAEIRAQFAAFAATGLALDHVDSHHHMHLHPTVLGILLEVGKEYGVQAMRLPFEPPRPSLRTAHVGALSRILNTLFLLPWIRHMAASFRRAGIHHNDRVFGLHDSGAMGADRLLAILDGLPEGCSEVYFHPTIATIATDGTPGSRMELAALTTPQAAARLRDLRIRSVHFSDLALDPALGAGPP
jgi:hopanoid biosynthesis associated protein HpnK